MVVSLSSITDCLIMACSNCMVLSSAFELSFALVSSLLSFSLYYLPASPSSSWGSSLFLISEIVFIMKKSRTVTKQRKTVPRWQFWKIVLAMILI